MGRNGKLTTYMAVGLTATGFALMFLGWNGAASTGFSERQFPYMLSATVPGLGLVMAGLTLALVQELRRSTARILERLGRLSDDAPVEGPMTTPVAAPDDGTHVAATATTFHRPDCRVIAGRTDLTTLSPDAAVERQLQPCRVCEPGTDASAA